MKAKITFPPPANFEMRGSFFSGWFVRADVNNSTRLGSMPSLVWSNNLCLILHQTPACNGL